MDRLSSVLTAVLAKRGFTAHAHASHLALQVQEWLKLEVPDMAPFLRMKHYKDGQLVLICDHSIAAQECRSVLIRLEAFVRKDCGEPRLKGIRLARPR